MKYILRPPLQHIAAVKIAVTLWNKNDIRALIEDFGINIFSRKWQKIEVKVTERVQQLPVPDLLKKEILRYIKPIGLQIEKWTEYHLPCYSDHELHLPSEFCWSPQGTIDWKKTAKVLINDNNIDILKCYKLAHVYCLGDSILEKLWNKIPENLRETLSYSNSDELFDGKDISFPWSYIRNEWSNHTFFSDLGVLELCASAGNKTAMEYFFQKLTTSEKEASLVKLAKFVLDSELMYFLLSQMNEEQQIEVFKSSPKLVLSCFLAWPFQGFFIEIANHLWEFMCDLDYVHIMTNIIYKVEHGYKDWDYQHLFRKLWQKCPKDVKSILMDERDVLLSLLEINDQENLKLVLQDATALQKKKLIDCGRGLDTIQKLICDKERDLVEYVLRECLSSKYEVINFKREFKKHLRLQRIRD